ncbi:MAG: choice-of-anchor B family protein [Bacteroidota bacterium]
MKRLLPYLFCCLSFTVLAQPIEANLLGTWTDPSIPATVFFGNPFNEVWGVAVNGSEIGIIGSTEGTHFIDVTAPTNPTEINSAFVAGGSQGIGIVHRDFHDFNNYLFAVADEGNTSTLQVIDISDLPNSTSVVYDSDEILNRAHNIFIDSTHARLYSCGARRTGTPGFINLQIIDIQDPTNPVLLRDYNEIPYVHDVYVKNNIAYANCGDDGFFVVDFSDIDNPIILGSMTTYPQQGYNHSGWLDLDEDYYYMADETWNTDLKVVDVSDFDDMSVEQTFNAAQTLTTIPHNLIVRCDLLYVSYYYEGLQVYDISNPLNPQRIFFYDTSTEMNTTDYEGAWGVYPFLPSGNILVSDMQNGLFVIEAVSAHECENITSTADPKTLLNSVKVFPQPATDVVHIEFQAAENLAETSVELIDLTGRTVQSLGKWEIQEGTNTWNFSLPTAVKSGVYFVKISNESWSVNQKLLIQKN